MINVPRTSGHVITMILRCAENHDLSWNLITNAVFDIFSRIISSWSWIWSWKSFLRVLKFTIRDIVDIVIEVGEEEKIEDEFDVFHRRRKFDRSSQTVYFFPRFKYVSELDIPFFLQLHVYSISFVSVFRRTRKRRKWGRNIQFGLMPQSVIPAAVFTQNKETHPSTSIFPRSCHRRSPFSKGGTLYPT